MTCAAHTLLTTADRKSTGLKPSVCVRICVCACVCVHRYGAYLYFQLVTHHEIFNETTPGATDLDDDEEPQLSVGAAMIMLTCITITVSFCSECVVAHTHTHTHTHRRARGQARGVSVTRHSASQLREPVRRIRGQYGASAQCYAVLGCPGRYLIGTACV